MTGSHTPPDSQGRRPTLVPMTVTGVCAGAKTERANKAGDKTERSNNAGAKTERAKNAATPRGIMAARSGLKVSTNETFVFKILFHISEACGSLIRELTPRLHENRTGCVAMRRAGSATG